ncbi:hypothetical protein QMP26_12425 [Enterocloster clostridioformis]
MNKGFRLEPEFFVGYLEQKEFSPNTISGYKRIVTYFLLFCQKISKERIGGGLNKRAIFFAPLFSTLSVLSELNKVASGMGIQCPGLPPVWQPRQMFYGRISENNVI